MRNIARYTTMTAAELAEELWSTDNCKRCAYKLKNEVTCNSDSRAGRKCTDGMAEWLRQEYKPKKTLREVFYERNPEAPKTLSLICPYVVGLGEACCPSKDGRKIACEDCWNREWKGEDEC